MSKLGPNSRLDFHFVHRAPNNLCPFLLAHASEIVSLLLLNYFAFLLMKQKKKRRKLSFIYKKIILYYKFGDQLY